MSALQLQRMPNPLAKQLPEVLTKASTKASTQNRCFSGAGCQIDIQNKFCVSIWKATWFLRPFADSGFARDPSRQKSATRDSPSPLEDLAVGALGRLSLTAILPLIFVGEGARFPVVTIRLRHGVPKIFGPHVTIPINWERNHGNNSCNC
jgi:hypothetical protein